MLEYSEGRICPELGSSEDSTLGLNCEAESTPRGGLVGLECCHQQVGLADLAALCWASCSEGIAPQGFTAGQGLCTLENFLSWALSASVFLLKTDLD